MRINLTVEDNDTQRAGDEMHKLLDDIWMRYPRAIVEKTKMLPNGRKIEFNIN